MTRTATPSNSAAQHRPVKYFRPLDLERLEPIMLLSADPYFRAFQVSSSSILFEEMGDGSVRQRLSQSPVFSVDSPRDYSGQEDDYDEYVHEEVMSAENGSVTLSFTAHDVFGYHALFSKDAYGQETGGHLTIFVVNGRVKARLQSVDESRYLYSPEGSVESGKEHHVAVTYGENGFWLYLDGRMVDWHLDFKQGLHGNTETLAIGANIWSRTPENPNAAGDFFDGRIREVAIYDTQLDRNDVGILTGFEYSPPQVEGRTYGTDADDSLSGNDVMAGYGDDLVVGTDGNDRLDGGHGEDRLEGGLGDDLLISRSDGREPYVAQDYGSEDDPSEEVNDETRTIYPLQPIEGDDVLVGGPGADTFRFEPLINAKEHIILAHVMEDGMIQWHRVAGENDFVHDHWVDRIGNDVIVDFSRAEGDKIEIVGHTADVYDLTHVDTDNDGIVDASVIYVQSNQGNSGAHNKDKLGTITVFGDLVLRSDYTVDSKPAYGIVNSIYNLDEAITPQRGTPVSLDGSPPPFPEPNDGTLPEGGVFGMLNPVDFSGDWEDHVEVIHAPAMDLTDGTIAFDFAADDVFGSHALFSKDGYGNFAGHITAFVSEGRVKVRLQDGEKDVWLSSLEGSVLPGDEHQVAVTFGTNGFWLYLDGRMVDWKTEFTQGISGNSSELAIGANIWGRSDSNPKWANSEFDGRISEFVVYDTQFNRHQVAELAGFEYETPEVPGRSYGTDAGEQISGSDVDAGYGDDLVTGTDGNDRLDGGHGEDRLEGGAGDDLLVSRSDGREPPVAQLYDPAEDDPDGEVNTDSRTHYPNQPIESNDVLVGGAGADIFRFEVLINAKEDIILDHVMDNRMIHWHGVAGENDEVHDHWVERLGHEIIEDFSRAEGDRIEVVGHTVDVYHLEHVDTDGDNIVDASVLYVQSNQGNAGAHNKDQLGTITVFGDLVTASDFTVDAQPAYGIVETIDELDEALAPKIGIPASYVDAAPAYPQVNGGTLPEDAVFGVLHEIDLLNLHDDEDYLEIGHDEDMELTSGTVSITFTPDDIWGRHTLFSKDADGKGEGGHLTAYIEDGRVKARLQSETENFWIWSPEGSVLAGNEYHVAVTFGGSGFALYLNGEPVDIQSEATQGIQFNQEGLVIGAIGWGRTLEKPYRAWDHFDGRISSFVLYGRQFSASEVHSIAHAAAG